MNSEPVCLNSTNGRDGFGEREGVCNRPFITGYMIQME